MTNKKPFYVYLDQNILDASIKGWFEWKKFKTLAEDVVFDQLGFKVNPVPVYSYASLEEERKRNKNENINKVLEFLKNCNAQCLLPVGNDFQNIEIVFSNACPYELFKGIKNQGDEDDRFSINTVSPLLLKLSGGANNSSYVEAYDKSIRPSEVIGDFERILQENKEELLQLGVYDDYKRQLSLLRKKGAEAEEELYKQFSEIDKQGDVQFELSPEQKNLKKFFDNSVGRYSSVPANEVISKIKNDLVALDVGIIKHLMKEEESLFNQILYLYNILNLFYCPDKKRKSEDGIRSSQADAMHSAYGSLCNIVVSNDERFCKKSQAIYSYLEIPAQAVHWNRQNGKFFVVP